MKRERRMSLDESRRCRDALSWFQNELEQKPDAVELTLPYLRLFTQAFFHRMLGPELYRQVSGTTRPPRTWRGREQLASGARDQVLQWRGGTPGQPLRDISLRELDAMLSFFGYRIQGRQILDVSRPSSTLVALQVKHEDVAGHLTLFARARVNYIDDADEASEVPSTPRTRWSAGPDSDSV